MKPSDLFVFGYFGYVSDQLDGQTVKTRMIHRLLEENTGYGIKYYDTELLKVNKLSLIVSLFRIIRAKHIIYLPAQNNLRKFFPILYFFSRVFNFKIHYFVVGGWLISTIEKNKSLIKKLSRIERLYVETDQMLISLKEDYKFRNVIWFPNFRFAKNIKSKNNLSNCLRLVFMSRITRQKGIDMIIDFAKETSLDVIIDFYGPIYHKDRNYFELSIKDCDKIKYKGQLYPEEIQECLSYYDVLLFPTRYYTEGLPGAIVDAYFAGIPVIATKWQCAEEFVGHGTTGFVIPFSNGYDQFKECIFLLYSDRSLLNDLKKNAKAFSKRFTSENAWKLIELYSTEFN